MIELNDEYILGLNFGDNVIEKAYLGNKLIFEFGFSFVSETVFKRSFATIYIPEEYAKRMFLVRNAIVSIDNREFEAIVMNSRSAPKIRVKGGSEIYDTFPEEFDVGTKFVIKYI